MISKSPSEAGKRHIAPTESILWDFWIFVKPIRGIKLGMINKDLVQKGTNRAKKKDCGNNSQHYILKKNNISEDNLAINQIIQHKLFLIS
jgi:hypothetical protein